MHLYLMVGVSVGRGRVGRAKVGQTNDDRGIDVVPRIPFISELYEKLTKLSISILKSWHAIFAFEQLT